jgi:hypothetical protein
MANWIKKATSKNKGAFGRQAKRAGMSTGAFARKVKGSPNKYSKTTVKRANLASTLGKLRKRA